MTKTLDTIILELQGALHAHNRARYDPHVLQVGDGLQHRVREILNDLLELRNKSEVLLYAEEEEQ